MTNEDAELQRVKDACESLLEHFDSVQIFTTRLTDEEPGDRGTVNVAYGGGNWFARYGQICAWVIKQDEQTRIELRDDR